MHFYFKEPVSRDDHRCVIISFSKGLKYYKITQIFAKEVTVPEMKCYNRSVYSYFLTFFYTLNHMI